MADGSRTPKYFPLHDYQMENERNLQMNVRFDLSELNGKHIDKIQLIPSLRPLWAEIV